MKKVKILIGFLMTLSALSLATPVSVEARSYRTKSSDVYVKGYTKKNGTYVAPHYRSAPDKSILNNYSCIDNGKCGGSLYTYSPPSYSFTTPVPTTIPAYTFTTPAPTPTPTPTYTYKPLPVCSDFSYFDGTQCKCKYGYTKSLKSDSCVPLNAACVELFGPSAIYREGDGLCHYCTTAGYTFDRGTSTCVPNQPIVTPTQKTKKYNGFVGIKKSSNGHRIQYFNDGSALDLETMEVVQ